MALDNSQESINPYVEVYIIDQNKSGFAVDPQVIISLDEYYNYHCYILSKTYASYYTSSSMSTYLGSSSVGHFWSATPWNYSYPAPCRTLVNTYPA